MPHALRNGGHSLKSPRVGIATRLIKCCLWTTFFLGVGGCSSGSKAMLDTARLLYNSSADTPTPSYNPSYRYLRTTVNGRVIYMVLGYVDKRREGAVEVWYSSSGEVVRLLDGRLVGTTGLSTDWREVRFSAMPPWPAGAADAPDASATPSSDQRFVRERDLMPGYRFGIRDDVVRIAVAPPQKSALTVAPPASLRWFEERSTSRPAAASVPPARFAISESSGTPRVVYSEQCISSDLCMSFERWTPVTPAAGTPSSAGT